MKRTFNPTRFAVRCLWAACFALFSAWAQWGYSQAAECSDLFIGEVLDGPGRNKAIELFNPTDSPVDLSLYSLEVYPDGSLDPVSVALTGTIGAKETFVVVHSDASTNLAVLADQLSSLYNPDGNDAIALVRSATLLDMVGEIGVDPGEGGWAVGSGATRNADLRRSPFVKGGQLDWETGQGEWAVFGEDDFTDLGNYIGICRNAVGYIVEVTQELLPSYPEDTCGSPACIDIGVSVAGSISAGDFIYVEIDQNFSCPNPTASPNVDASFPNGVVVVLTDFNPSDRFRLRIIDDAVLEPDEHLCFEITAGGNTVLNGNQNSLIVDNDMVGISETLGQLGIQIGPNPATEEVLIQGLGKAEFAGIYTAQGNLVSVASQPISDGLILETRCLPSGLYLVRFVFQGRHYSYSLVHP